MFWWSHDGIYNSELVLVILAKDSFTERLGLLASMVPPTGPGMDREKTAATDFSASETHSVRL